jgi:hypothetical protein
MTRFAPSSIVDFSDGTARGLIVLGSSDSFVSFHSATPGPAGYQGGAPTESLIASANQRREFPDGCPCHECDGKGYITYRAYNRYHDEHDTQEDCDRCDCTGRELCAVCVERIAVVLDGEFCCASCDDAYRAEEAEGVAIAEKESD